MYTPQDSYRSRPRRLGSRSSHWNTDNPQLVRGVAQDGCDLVISRDDMSQGLRSRAEDLASAEPGPRPEHEIRSGLEREFNAVRWARLDAAIRIADDPSNGAASAPPLIRDISPKSSGR
jgi:type IV secretory pathway VirD2 relaxase